MNDINTAPHARIIAEDTAVPETRSSDRDPADVVRDPEPMRLIRGYGDLFATIGTLLLTLAVSEYVSRATQLSVLGSLVLIVLTLALAEYFVLKKRFALASIVCMGNVLSAAVMILLDFPMTSGVVPMEASYNDWENNGLTNTRLALTAGLIPPIGYLLLRRYQVPITPAFTTLTSVGALLILVERALPGSFITLLFLAGCITLGLAWRMDQQDLSRETMRSDRAFWLHVLAAPAIVHPLFHWSGVLTFSDIGAEEALVGTGLFILFTVLGLLINRRGVVLASTVYFLIVIVLYLQERGSPESWSVAFLLSGTALILLAMYWERASQGLRAGLVHLLGR